MISKQALVSISELVKSENDLFKPPWEHAPLNGRPVMFPERVGNVLVDFRNAMPSLLKDWQAMYNELHGQAEGGNGDVAYLLDKLECRP
jgi:hypothetical protein